MRNLKKPSRGKWPNKLWHDYKISRERLITSIFEEAERLNLNNLELAKEAKLAHTTVYNLDNYITIEPRETTIWKLARAVGMKVEVKKERVQLKLKKVS